MQRFYSLLFFAGILFLATGCANSEKTDLPDDEYAKQIETWRSERVSKLTAPDGWLSLAGLYFLKQGENHFGSEKGNDLLFPPFTPTTMGTILLEGDSIHLTFHGKVKGKINGDYTSSTSLPVHTESTPGLVTWGSLSWFVLQRGDRFLVRLRDSNNEAIGQFTSIDQYAIDQSWRLPARFVPFAQPELIEMKNVLDMNIGQASEGVLAFEVDQQSFELAVLDGGEDEYFVIFADQTTGEDTYGGGRYLYVPKPDASGSTFIDFNKAHNPPCAFTPYATCLLPPDRNHLDLAVLAGEKGYGEH